MSGGISKKVSFNFSQYVKRAIRHIPSRSPSKTGVFPAKPKSSVRPHRSELDKVLEALFGVRCTAGN